MYGKVHSQLEKTFCVNMNLGTSINYFVYLISQHLDEDT